MYSNSQVLYRFCTKQPKLRSCSAVLRYIGSTVIYGSHRDFLYNAERLKRSRAVSNLIHQHLAHWQCLNL